MENNLERAIKFIKTHEPLSVRVSLHIHNDEEFLNSHSIQISIEKAKRHFQTFNIDLEGMELKQLRRELVNTHLEILKHYNSATKHEYIHEDEDYGDED